jgi:protein-S-isoprenylcysteine O-methyltransferase Ste14
VRRTTAGLGTAAFFVAAPGLAAGLIPWLLTRWQAGNAGGFRIPLIVAGSLLTLAGTAVLVQAFARFVTEGRGTPAPVAPTERLVVGGLYRFVRNPMYLAVLTAIVGQALILARPVLLAYAATLWVVFAAFVRLYEEPTLFRQFGESYDEYRRAVPAWWPRRTAWEPGEAGRN